MSADDIREGDAHEDKAIERMKVMNARSPQMKNWTALPQYLLS